METELHGQRNLGADAYTYLVPAQEGEDAATAAQIAYANLLLAQHTGSKVCGRWIKPDGAQVAALSSKRCHQLISNLKRDPAMKLKRRSRPERIEILKRQIHEKELEVHELEWRRDDEPEFETEYAAAIEAAGERLEALRDRLRRLEEEGSVTSNQGQIARDAGTRPGAERRSIGQLLRVRG